MLKVSMFLFINFLNSIAYNNIILKQKTIKKPSYLTGFIYFILSLPLVNLENNVVILISSFLLINLYGNIINLHQSHEIKKTILKISFFLSCLLIIDFQFILFFPLTIGTLFYYQQFNWRNIIIQLLSIVYVIGTFYAFAFLFFSSNNWGGGIIQNMNYLQLFNYPIIITLFITLLFALTELNKNFYKKTESSKKGFYILFCFFLITIASVIIFRSFNFAYLIAIPTTIVISNYLIYTKYKKFRTFLLGLLIILFILKFLYP